MKNKNRLRADRRGAMMVLVAVTLPLIVIMAAFAIDVAWMHLVKTELRTATDAASRAGAKTLSLRQDEVAARAAARRCSESQLGGRDAAANGRSRNRNRPRTSGHTQLRDSPLLPAIHAKTRSG